MADIYDSLLQTTELMDSDSSPATTAAIKAAKLEVRTQEKLQRLSQNTNLTNSFSQLESGALESNKNKIWNDLTGSDIQGMISDAASKYQLYNEGDKWYQGTGADRKEYTGDFSDTQRAYMYGVKGDSDAVKFGLARGDLPNSNYRYLPGQAEAEGYNVGKKGYGWDSGIDGVDINKNYMDMLLPKDVATALEAAVHGRKSAMDNRVYPNMDSLDKNRIGDGASEYYTSAEGMLGNSQLSVGPTEGKLEEYMKLAPKDTYVKPKVDFEDKSVEAYASSGSKLTYEDWKNRDDQENSDALVDGLQVAAARWWGKAQEGAGELLKSIAVKDKEFIDKEDVRLKSNYNENVSDFRKSINEGIKNAGEFLTKRGEFIKANALEYYGYNDAGSKTASAVWGELKQGNVVKALENVSTEGVIGLIAESLPEMAMMYNPTTFVATYAGNVAEAKKEAEKVAGGNISTGRMSAILVGEALSMSLDKAVFDGLIKPSTAGSIVEKTAEKLGNVVPTAVLSGATKYALNKIGNVAMSASKEAGQEAIQEGQRIATTQLGAKDVLTEENLDRIGESLVGGGLAGGGIRAGVETVTTVPDVVAGTRMAKEYLDDKLGTEANTESTDRAATTAGRKTRFETDPTKVAPDSRPVFAKDVMEYASELWLSPDRRSGTSYEKKPSAIIDDTVDYISKMYDVKSIEGKNAVEAEVARHMLDLTNRRDSDNGGVEVMPNKTEKDSVIQNILAKFKGNAQVEAEVEKYYEKQLADKFEDVKVRLSKEGVNVEDLSKQGLLTTEELTNLESVLTDMRKMGSEELTSTADRISSALSARQERLGSEGEGKSPTKKTAAEVKDEIETLGFLTRGKKSLQQHKRDIGTIIDNPLASDESIDEEVGALESFVATRDDKVRVFDKKSDKVRIRSIGEIRSFAKATMNDNKTIVSTIKELLASSKNEKVNARLSAALDKVQEVNSSLSNILESRHTTDADIALYKTLYDAMSPKEKSDADKKALDAYLDEYTTKSGNVQTESRPVVEPIDTKTATHEAEMRNVEYLAKKATDEGLNSFTSNDNTMFETLTPEYKNAVANRIKELKKTDSIKDEEVVKSNNKTESKDVNRADDIIEEIDTEAVDKATLPKKEVAREEITPKQSLDMYKSLLDSTSTLLEETKSMLATSSKVKSKLAPEYTAIENAKRKIETIGGIKESIAAMKNAIKYYQSNLNAVVADKKATMNKLAILNNSLKDHIKELDKLKNQFSRLEDSIDSKSRDLSTRTSNEFKNVFLYTVSLLKKAITNLKARLVKIGVKIVNKEVDIIDTKLNIAKYENTLTEADRYIAEFESVIDIINNNIEDTKVSSELVKEGKVELQQAYKNLNIKYNELLDAEGLTKDSIDRAKKDLKSLQVEVNKYKSIVESATRQSFRQDIENVLGDAVKPNNSTKTGLSNRLFNGATAEELMEIMPNIISKSKKGLSKVTEAMEYFDTFEKQRLLIPTRKQQEDGITVANLLKYINQDREEQSAVLSKTGIAKLFSTKSIEDKLSKAINVTSVITLDNIINARDLKGDQLTSFVDGAFSSLWRNDYSLRAVMLPTLELMVQRGEAIPIATFYRNAGKRLLEELEIKLNLDPQDKEDVIRALGAIVIDNIYATNSEASTNKGLAKRAIRINKTTLELETVTKFTEDGQATTDRSSKGIKTINVRGYKFAKELNSIARVFEYAGEKSDGTIGFSPFGNHKAGDLGRNSNTPLTKKEADYLNKVGSKAWTFVGSGIGKLLEQVNGDVDALVVSILGTKQDILNKVNVMDVESEIAKYESEELDIKRMIMAYEMVGDKPFYMDWDLTISNRAMLSNKLINPQNSKISRFLVSMDGMVTDLTKDDLNDTLLAMAQAFEMDPDKKSDEDVIAEFREVVDIRFRDGKFVIDSISDKMSTVLNADNTLKAIRKEFGKEVSSKNIMHIYQAVELVRKINNGDKLRTNLALEIDGITNGMATTILQIGLLSGVKNMFKKVGVYLDGDVNGIKNHAQFKKDGGKDFYETPIVSFQTELSTMDKSVNELVTKLIGGKWRSFLKPLVMVFAYGAGVRNISAAASMDIALKMIAKASTEKELQSMMDVFITQVPAGNELAKLIEEASKLKTQIGKYELTPDGMLKFVETTNGKLKVSESSLNAMTEVINIAISPALTTAFSNEFDTITKYRQTIKVVSMLNYIASTMSFRDKSKGRAYNELSEKEIRSIYDDMIKDGTYYGAINPNGGVQDYFNTQSMPSTEGNVVTINLSSSSINAYVRSKGYKGTINQIVKDLASNVGAVGVIDVHSIDGATMISGNVKDVLNIFDALVMGVNHKANNEQARIMNEVYYQINMQHSILGNMIGKVTSGESLKYLEKMKLSKPHELVDLVTDFNRIYGKSASDNTTNEEVRSTIANVLGMIHDIDAGRRRLVEKDADINQYYVSDRYEPASWTKSKLQNTRYAAFSNDEKTAAIEKGVIQDLLVSLGDLIIRSKKDIKDNKLKAGGDLYTQSEFSVSSEDLARIDRANTEFLSKNKNIKVVEGTEFSYSNGVITVDSAADFGDRIVFLAHEIVHAKTAEWLNDNRNSSMVAALTKNIDNVLSILENKPINSMSEGEVMLRSRLLHDNGHKSLRLLENVAVLASEPAMRAELLKLLPSSNRGLVDRILDKVKAWLGKELPMDAKKILTMVDKIVVKAEPATFNGQIDKILNEMKECGV